MDAYNTDKCSYSGLVRDCDIENFKPEYSILISNPKAKSFGSYGNCQNCLVQKNFCEKSSLIPYVFGMNPNHYGQYLGNKSNLNIKNQTYSVSNLPWINYNCLDV
jgi:hypothetical protein